MNKKTLALGRLKDGEMNKTEQAYADNLEYLKSIGTILWYKFEPMRLRLAKGSGYTPDFMVMLADRTLEFHEVKGFWRDDAKVKIKVASDLYPMYKFFAVFKKKDGWEYEEF